MITDKALLEHHRKDVIGIMMKILQEPLLQVTWNDDETATIIDANLLACCRLNYNSADLLNLNLFELFAPESAPIARKKLGCQPEKNNDFWEGVLLTFDGQKMPVEVKNYHFYSEEGNQILISFRDITKRKKNLTELNNYKTLLNRAEAVGKFGYWEYDIKTQKFWGSRGARIIYGVGHKELTLDDIKTIPLPEYRPALDSMFHNLISSFGKYDLEFKICRPDDGIILDVHSIADFDIVEKKVFGLVQNISEQKKVENEIIMAKEKAEEADRLKTAFLKNMSHEIRTPMNGIIGFTDLLIQPHLSNEAKADYGEIIKRSCNNLLTVITDILDISRIETDQVNLSVKDIDLSVFLNEVLEVYKPLASQKDILLFFTPPLEPSVTIINTDETMLNRILSNIIENAIRFTSDGYVEFGYQLKNGFCEFYVQDSGIGIDTANFEIIFERFRQAEVSTSQYYGGTGLGLAISKSFVNMLGGTIWVNSKLGEGSTFYFTLPCQNSTHKPIKTPPKVQTSNSNNRFRCLIADDIEMNYAYLKTILESDGYEVLWAQDGYEAIEKVKSENVDIVLMDVKMPNLNGYEATKIIKGLRPNLPVFFQTAYANMDDNQKALEAGGDDYITKPIHKQELLWKLNMLLKKRNLAVNPSS